MAIVRFYPSMFIQFCKDRIKVPDYADQIKEYPHFCVFYNSHVGRAFTDEQLEHNAEIIGKISDDKIKKVTMKELIELGFDNNPSKYWD